MKTKVYESLVIINAAIEEDQIETALTRITETITVNGGEIIEIEKWGRKRLTYPIEKSKSGYYAIFRFKAPTDLIAKLERMYQLDEHIVRHVTLSLNKFALEHIEKMKSQSKNELVIEKGEESVSVIESEEKVNED